MTSEAFPINQMVPAAAIFPQEAPPRGGIVIFRMRFFPDSLFVPPVQYIHILLKLKWKYLFSAKQGAWGAIGTSCAPS